MPAFPKLHMPDLKGLGRAPRIALIGAASLLGALLLAWIILNVLLANPRFGTPAVNWALGAFAARDAKVETAQLKHPFSDTFVTRGLNWPDRATAKEVDVAFDLFGFLPGRAWTKFLRARDGDVTLLKSAAKRNTAFDPQKFINRIDAQNITLHYTRRDVPREVTIVEASGSFAKGNVKAEAASGASRITYDGSAAVKGGGSLSGAVTATGENLADLAELVGVSAPDTPPFNLTGALDMENRSWSVTDIKGRMGDSDIGGAVAIDLKPDKPFLNVDLTSASLDFDDLGVVFGIPVGVDEGETTNETQRKARAAFNRSSRLIPDARIDVSRLAAVNGDISFDAAKVVDAPSGINALLFKGELRDSILDFERVLVKTATGDLDAKVRIDAQKEPAQTKASGKLENVAITRVVATQFVKGTLNGSFALNLTGSGFREAFGSATGEAGVWSSDSEVAKIATEAAGLDAGEILLLLATESGENREYLKSKCLVANIAFADGRATFSPAIVDNSDSTIIAQGGVDLKTERLDVQVMSDPKDVSIGKLFGDIRVKGTLRDPAIEALNTKTILQAGFAGLLSTVTGSLLALPFIETGGGEDAPCADIVAYARKAGQTQDPTLRQR